MENAYYMVTQLIPQVVYIAILTSIMLYVPISFIKSQI